jgi:flagellar L-ring protein precursor FlgH
MSYSSVYIRVTAVLLLLALLSGCAQIQQRQKQEDAEWAATAPIEQPAPPQANGSIHQPR